MLWIYYTLLIIDFVMYFSSFYLVWKRKDFQEITIRSPFLLTMNILGGFFITLTFILFEIFKIKNDEGNMRVFCFTIPYQFFTFHMLMILSFFLRCHRIILCCNISGFKKDEDFIKKKHLFT